MLLRRTAQRAFPVVGSRGYEGMLDAAAVDRAWPSQLARDIAHAVPVVSSSSLDEDALPLLADSPTKASAVVDEGRVVGLLRLEDVEHLVADLARRRDRA